MARPRKPVVVIAGLLTLSVGAIGAILAEEPMVDMRQTPITQIGIVVADAVATAKSYGDLFGIGPWSFYDFALSDTVLRGERVVSSTVRVAVAPTASLQLALVQPLSGPSLYRDFLEHRGAGVHHVSFGLGGDHHRILSRLTEAGAEIGMRTLVDDSIAASYLSTEDTLGTVFELLDNVEGATFAPTPWGTWEASDSPAVSTADKRLMQIGIVVPDAEAAARAYWELFGIGPWSLVDFVPPHVASAELHGVPMREDIDFRVKGALAMHGDIQLELLEPARGPGTHMEFLQRHGPGVHHMSFGAVADHDKIVETLASRGVEVEMTGQLGGTSVFTYLATQERLGTIFEIVDVVSSAQSTLVPYGVYPPPE